MVLCNWRSSGATWLAASSAQDKSAPSLQRRHLKDCGQRRNDCPPHGRHSYGCVCAVGKGKASQRFGSARRSRGGSTPSRPGRRTRPRVEAAGARTRAYPWSAACGEARRRAVAASAKARRSGSAIPALSGCTAPARKVDGMPSRVMSDPKDRNVRDDAAHPPWPAPQRPPQPTIAVVHPT